MSVLGIAREVAALTWTAGCAVPRVHAVDAQLADTFPVRVDDAGGCPTFLGRVFRDINNRARHRRRGSRHDCRALTCAASAPSSMSRTTCCLSLGSRCTPTIWPAFSDEIRVRYARARRNSCSCSTGATVNSERGHARDRRPRAADWACRHHGRRAHRRLRPLPRNVFLEVAYFAPSRGPGTRTAAGAADRCQPALRARRRPRPAAARHGTCERTARADWRRQGRSGNGRRVARSISRGAPRSSCVASSSRVCSGREIAAAQVTASLAALQMKVEADPAGWQVTPPSHRADIAIEADLIEEVARMVGFDKIAEDGCQDVTALRAAAARAAFRGSGDSRALECPRLPGSNHLRVRRSAAAAPALSRIARRLRSRIPLQAIFRSCGVSLWPGLLRAAAQNQHRQQERIRLMERGVCFIAEEGATREEDTTGGARLWQAACPSSGACHARRAARPISSTSRLTWKCCWSQPARKRTFSSRRRSCPVCTPAGRRVCCARDAAVGWIGELHPQIARELDFTYPPVLFELAFYDALRVQPAGLRGGVALSDGASRPRGGG